MATSFSHPHHTHLPSYDEDAHEDTRSSEGERDAWSHRQHEQVPSAEGAFLSPPPSSLRPPVEDGLQPDPGYHRPDQRSSVGRFQVVEGSPNRGPVDNSGGHVSPIASEAIGRTAATAHHHHHQSAHAPPSLPMRTFFTPHFPSMSVHGVPTTLSLTISSLPSKGVAISPSASGLEFTPPKLKFTSSGKREATFTATPLATAKEGKVKVCWIVTGDDASDYTEPPCSTFRMFAEDHPLPLPSPPMEYDNSGIFSPSLSDASETTSNASESRGEPGSGRAAFLASGVPRQSGRFTVIDEELGGNGNPTPARQSSDQSQHDNRAQTPPPAAFAGGDNPFHLLARMQGCLAHLVEQNTRLREENERLRAENNDWRARAGFSDYSCQPAASAASSAAYHQRAGSKSRTNSMDQPHPQLSSQLPPSQSHHPPFEHTVSTAQLQQQQRPHGSAVAAHNARYSSLPAGGLPSSAVAAAAGGRPPSQQQTATQSNTSGSSQPPSSAASKPTPPVVMNSHCDKRQTLPANFSMPGRNSGTTSAPAAGPPRLPHGSPAPLISTAASHPVPSAIAVTSPGGNRRTATPTGAGAMSPSPSPSMSARTVPPQPLPGGPSTPTAGGHSDATSPQKANKPSAPATPTSTNRAPMSPNGHASLKPANRRKSMEMKEQQVAQISQISHVQHAAEQNSQHGR